MSILRARTHFTVGRRHVRPGDLVSDGDEVVKGREHLFQPVEELVESATSRPGEKRSTRRSPKKAAEQVDSDD